MKDKHPSLSNVQNDAQEKMLRDFERRNKGIKLEHEKVLSVGVGSTIKVDGYSKERQTVCEAWAHIGPTKPGQIHKVMQDVLKMLLLEKSLGYGLKKFYIFVDDKSTNEASTKFSNGTSWMATCFQEFGIKIFLAKLPKVIIDKIRKAQKDEGVRRGKK